jgi:hypothetical protein
MVATVVAALVGWLAFSSHALARRWLLRPTWGHIELAPGNTPIPVLPRELPVARVMALPPRPSNRQIIGRMVEIVHAKKRRQCAGTAWFHRQGESATHCPACHDFD